MNSCDFPTSDFCETYEIHCEAWRNGKCNCRNSDECPAFNMMDENEKELAREAV